MKTNTETNIEKKKEMYYRGKVMLQKDRLGHQFLEFRNGQQVSEINFIDKKSYGFGCLYEVTIINEKQLRIGNYLNKDMNDQKVLEKWKIENLAHKTRFETSKQNKKFLVERNKGLYENMTLKELKEKCDGDYEFRKIILYAICGGQL
jgi:hypothetical protein